MRYILNNALVHTPIQNVYVFLCSPPNQTSVLKTLNNAFVLGAEGVKEALHSIEWTPEAVHSLESSLQQ